MWRAERITGPKTAEKASGTNSRSGKLRSRSNKNNRILASPAAAQAVSQSKMGTQQGRGSRQLITQRAAREEQLTHKQTEAAQDSSKAHRVVAQGCHNRKATKRMQHERPPKKGQWRGQRQWRGPSRKTVKRSNHIAEPDSCKAHVL